MFYTISDSKQLSMRNCNRGNTCFPDHLISQCLLQALLLVDRKVLIWTAHPHFTSISCCVRHGKIDSTSYFLWGLGNLFCSQSMKKFLFHTNFSFNIINIRRLCRLGKLYSASFINFILVLMYLWWSHKNLHHNPWLMQRLHKFLKTA